MKTKIRCNLHYCDKSNRCLHYLLPNSKPEITLNKEEDRQRCIENGYFESFTRIVCL